jgi:hypothetical protein
VARANQRRAVEQLRASPPPSFINVALHGLGAGAAAGTVSGLLYAVLFGVVGYGLSRWTGSSVLTGYSGPLFPLFLGTLAWTSLYGGALSLPYHFLCRLFPRLAGLAGGIGFLLGAGLLVTVAASAMLGPPVGLQLSGALRAFNTVSGLVSALIIGAVIGQAELFERTP